MQTLDQLLNTKGREVWRVAPGDSVLEAIKQMAEKHAGALLVMDGDALVGIVSERDYARKVILEGRSSRETPVKDIMTSRVLYVGPDKSVQECLALMTSKRIRHLPILEDHKVVGVVSIGDLVKAVIAEQQFMIEQLTQYIGGGPS